MQTGKVVESQIQDDASLVKMVTMFQKQLIEDEGFRQLLCREAGVGFISQMLKPEQLTSAAAKRELMIKIAQEVKD